MTDVLEGLTETEVRDGYGRAIRLIERLADANDTVTRVQIVRMLQSANPADPLPDLGAMLDRVLDERDELRRRIDKAVERLERAGGGMTVAILRGRD